MTVTYACHTQDLDGHRITVRYNTYGEVVLFANNLRLTPDMADELATQLKVCAREVREDQ